MTIARVDDHVASGLALLLSQYQGKPRLETYLSIFLRRVQELEDAVWDVLISRLIDTATGIHLDTLGRLVGQVRLWADDEIFRVWIRARIRANRSQGHPDDVIQVAQLAVDGLEFEYRELYAASFVVDVLDALEANLASPVHEIVMRAKAVGAAGSLHWSDSPEESTFAFAVGDEEEDDEDRGFSGDDPDEGPGGVLIGAF